MNGLELGRLLRMSRMRRGWRLTDLEVRTGLSAESLSRHERGHLTSIDRLRRHAAAFELRVDFRVTGRSADVPRLLDDEHAAIAATLAGAFGADGWEVEPEASYSEWGERGRIDLLAFRPLPPPATVAVVEVKADIADLQSLFGSLNAKERLATTIASRRGWNAPRVVVVLAVAATHANRVTVDRHAPLFAAFTPRRFRSHTPSLAAAKRILLWIPAPTAQRRLWLAGRRRIRRASGRPNG